MIIFVINHGPLYYTVKSRRPPNETGINFMCLCHLTLTTGRPRLCRVDCRLYTRSSCRSYHPWPPHTWRDQIYKVRPASEGPLSWNLCQQVKIKRSIFWLYGRWTLCRFNRMISDTRVKGIRSGIHYHVLCRVEKDSSSRGQIVSTHSINHNTFMYTVVLSDLFEHLLCFVLLPR